jgi:hypothetical protein
MNECFLLFRVINLTLRTDRKNWDNQKAYNGKVLHFSETKHCTWNRLSNEIITNKNKQQIQITRISQQWKMHTLHNCRRQVWTPTEDVYAASVWQNSSPARKKTTANVGKKRKKR